MAALGLSLVAVASAVAAERIAVPKELEEVLALVGKAHEASEAGRGRW